MQPLYVQFQNPQSLLSFLHPYDIFHAVRNAVAIQANTYGGIYPEEIAALQRDYAALWGPLSDLLKKLSALVEL